MEGGEWRADTGRTTKGYGGGRRAEREKFLLRFSKAQNIIFIIIFFQFKEHPFQKFTSNNDFRKQDFFSEDIFAIK